MLPIDAKDKELGKWSPKWEGPFKVHQVLLGSLEGEPHKRFIYGKYLKKYFPTMWEMLDTAYNTSKYSLVVFNVFRVFCRYNLKIFVIIMLLSEKILKPRICTRYKGKSGIFQNRI